MGKKNEEQVNEQSNRQSAQQASQQAGQTEGTIRSGFIDKEANDTGMGERAQIDNASDSHAWRANMKRTYDEYQGESLTSIREQRQLTARLAQNAVSHDEVVQNLATQALQNAVETANMVAKQAVRHGDVAIDGHWNPVQQGAGDALTIKAVQLDDASMKALATIMATAIGQAFAAQK